MPRFTTRFYSGSIHNQRKLKSKVINKKNGAHNSNGRMCYYKALCGWQMFKENKKIKIISTICLGGKT